MKKISVIVMLVLATILLTGCGNASAMVSDHKEVLIQFGDEKITRGDLYKNMLKNDKGYTVVSEATALIVSSEIETNDDIMAEAKQTLDDYKEQMDGDIETLLESLGYATEEDLLNSIIVRIKGELLLDKYFAEKIDELWQEYAPVKAKIMVFDSENDVEGGKDFQFRANEALELLNTDTFENVANLCSDNPELAEESIYTKVDNDRDINLLQFFAEAKGPETKLIYGEDEDVAYIVRITVTNQAQLAEDFKEMIKTNENFTKDANHYYAELHNFQIFDIQTYNDVKENYSEFIIEK